jgi:hypothetical protein
MVYYLAIKKNETLSFVTAWVELAIVELSEKPDTERQVLSDLTYMCNIKKLTS